jgi:natural product biosynthesis luciferase-like monooxygenase protein
MDFSLFYFANQQRHNQASIYRLLLEGARFADTHGFSAIWTPERHFHPFGGGFPNPAVTGAAVALVTRHVDVRAGNVVAPLHHPIRIAEEWSVVDNLSDGRSGVSFASGWNPLDFALAPASYDGRKSLTTAAVEMVRRVWRGEHVDVTDGNGHSASVRLFPTPVQDELPVWLTSSGNEATFREAGRLRANLLTHLLGQDIDTLAGKIALYRAAYGDAGGADRPGIVTLMLHTFLGDDIDAVREKVRRPFSAYLRSALELELAASAIKRPQRNQDVDQLVARTFDRYFYTSGLFGPPESCFDLVSRLAEIGVDEIACLIDFGVDEDEVLESLKLIAALAGCDRSAGQVGLAG